MASAFFFDAEPLCEPSVPSLDACALCASPLGRDSDIFMYRGDTPFCSEDCRHQQMQLDAVRARSAARRQRRQYASGAAGSSSRHHESRKVSVVAS